jgi:hypothetical protein
LFKNDDEMAQYDSKKDSDGEMDVDVDGDYDNEAPPGHIPRSSSAYAMLSMESANNQVGRSSHYRKNVPISLADRQYSHENHSGKYANRSHYPESANNSHFDAAYHGRSSHMQSVRSHSPSLSSSQYDPTYSHGEYQDKHGYNQQMPHGKFHHGDSARRSSYSSSSHSAPPYASNHMYYKTDSPDGNSATWPLSSRIDSYAEQNPDELDNFQSISK